MPRLVPRLQHTRDSIYSLSDRLGVVGHCDLRLTQRGTNTSLTVSPRPRLIEPSSQTLYKFHLEQTIELNREDKMLTGVTRDGTELYIQNGAICYINDRPYTILWVDKNRLHDYEILVRPERAR